MEALSKDQLLKVLAAAKQARQRDWLMFLVAYHHALRVSEVIAITRDRIDGGFIDIPRLKGSRRTVQPLIAHANPLLNEAQAIFDYVAVMHGNQKLFPIGARQAERLFARYAARADVPKYKRHPHVLKHTCLTQILPIVGISNTQCWAGHKSGASTLMYTRVSDQDAAAAITRALRD